MTTLTTSVSDSLAELARQWSDTPAAIREPALSALIHPDWAGAHFITRADAWAEYMDAVLRLDGLCDGCGTDDWHYYSDSCSSPEDVYLMVAGWVDEAAKTLINGPRRGAGTGGRR